MTEDIKIALIAAIGSLLSGIISAYATIKAAQEKSEKKPGKRSKKSNLWRNILSISGVVLVVSVAVILGLISSGGDSSPTPTVIVTSISNEIPTLLHFGNGFPFTDRSGVGNCQGIPNEIKQLDRVNAIAIAFSSGQNGYCGWEVLLKDYDLSSTKQISFWVKGEKGGEHFKVGIRDTHTEPGKEPKVFKEAPADWAQITILVDEFTPRPDFSSLDNLSLSFESGSGKIYVDQLIFAP